MHHPSHRLRLVLVALLAAGLASGPVALASHMTAYTATPEHDDIGRSNEPDNLATAVLGPLVTSCNVDNTLDGMCEVYSTVTPNPVTGVRVVAPGCWTDAGRQPSGPCFLTLQGGTPIGMSGNRAPGAFTTTKADPVRFLDAQTYVQPVAAYAGELNHKLGDTGAAALLGTLGFGNRVVLGPTGLNAWYGTWTDLNGNGVIDHTDTEALNEFVWRGDCLDGDGNPLNKPRLCAVETVGLLGWMFPANHHAFVIPDAPGMQALCFASFLTAAGLCAGALEDFDQWDRDFWSDPLLGEQSSVRPDFAYDDRTGEAVNGRQWIGGNGFAFWHYDQSVVVSEYIVTAADAPPTSLATGFNPAAGRFRDVDLYRSWNPVLEGLLQSTVKPTSRGAWQTFLSTWNPVNKLVDGRVNSQHTGLGALNPFVGPVDDAVLNPGWSHEPNHPGDVYPGATRGTCADGDDTHAGFCNRYAGYQSGPHAFADNQAFRTVNLVSPDVAGNALPGIYGPAFVDGSSVGPAHLPRAPGDHRRSLAPGGYDFFGSIGVWTDKAHRMDNDLGQVVGKDGWVGNVLNTTGQFRYRDYLPEPCALYGVLATYEYAQCHPYAHGTFQDPQDYTTSDTEFAGQCTTNTHVLTLFPDGGVWTAPTFVWRGMERFEVTEPRLEDWTGRSTPLTLRIECIDGTATTSGAYVGRDILFLPAGNVGLGVTMRLTTAPLVLASGATEVVVDVDHYAPYA